jgi:predicted RNA methylase
MYPLTHTLCADFDTVVMNPPFGTRNTGIDTAFVLKGMEYASVVYSLHKTSTRDVSN